MTKTALLPQHIIRKPPLVLSVLFDACIALYNMCHACTCVYYTHTHIYIYIYRILWIKIREFDFPQTDLRYSWENIKAKTTVAGGTVARDLFITVRWVSRKKWNKTNQISLPRLRFFFFVVACWWENTCQPTIYVYINNIKVYARCIGTRLRTKNIKRVSVKAHTQWRSAWFLANFYCTYYYTHTHTHTRTIISIRTTLRYI